jgi:hypothetical protein
MGAGVAAVKEGATETQDYRIGLTPLPLRRKQREGAPPLPIRFALSW